MSGIQRAYQVLAKAQGAAGIGVCSRATSFAAAGCSWRHAAIQHPATHAFSSQMHADCLGIPVGNDTAGRLAVLQTVREFQDKQLDDFKGEMGRMEDGLTPFQQGQIKALQELRDELKSHSETQEEFLAGQRAQHTQLTHIMATLDKLNKDTGVVKGGNSIGSTKRRQEPNNRHVLQSPYFWGGVCYQAATMGISMYGAVCAIKFFM